MSGDDETPTSTTLHLQVPRRLQGTLALHIPYGGHMSASPSAAVVYSLIPHHLSLIFTVQTIPL